MIYTDRKITVTDGNCKIDTPIILYRGDRGLEIAFEIVQSKFKFGESTNYLKTSNAAHGQLIIKKPDGGNIFSEISQCEDGKVKFAITEEMIDEIPEVGFYSMQIRLYSDDKEARITIPPVDNAIEVREPIAIEDDNPSLNEGVVGQGAVGYALVEDDNVVEDIFDDNGNYNKTSWFKGDLISAAKLNKIEIAIESNTNTLNSNKDNSMLGLEEHTIQWEVDIKINRDECTEGSYITEMGSTDNILESCMYSGYIPVKPNTKYTLCMQQDDERSWAITGCAYDENKTYLGALPPDPEINEAPHEVIFVTGTNWHFIRINISIAIYNEGKWYLREECVSRKSIANNLMIGSHNICTTNMIYTELLNHDTIEVGYYTNTGHLITSDSNIGHTDFIPVDSSNSYEIYIGDLSGKKPWFYAITMYDNNQEFISMYPTDQSNVVAKISDFPSECKFIKVNVGLDSQCLSRASCKESVLCNNPTEISWLRVSENNLNDSLVSKINSVAGAPAFRNWAGKTANFLGDSITQGIGATSVKYVDVVKDIMNLKKVNNYGISGTKIADSGNDNSAMSIRYTNMDANADIVFVLGGTNDYGHTTTAAFGSFEDRTVETFYGALHVLCIGLLTNFVGKEIVFITPIHRVNDRTPNSTTNKSLEDYVNAIKEVTKYYGIPVLDFFSDLAMNPMVPIIKSTYMPDGLHPNDAGHQVMGEKIARFMTSI